jgi:predicted transcriptional regulator
LPKETLALGNGFLRNNSLGTKLNASHSPLAILKNRDYNSKSLRRGKLDIAAEILLFCEQQQKTKTSIMYNTNLNYAQLKRHIDTLVSQGLLIKNANKFSTTEKGYRFLSLFGELNDLIEQV